MTLPVEPRPELAKKFDLIIKRYRANIRDRVWFPSMSSFCLFFHFFDLSLSLFLGPKPLLLYLLQAPILWCYDAEMSLWRVLSTLRISLLCRSIWCRCSRRLSNRANEWTRWNRWMFYMLALHRLCSDLQEGRSLSPMPNVQMHCARWVSTRQTSKNVPSVRLSNVILNNHTIF